MNGSIPACAGEPVTQAARLTQAAVYPRVCGGTKTNYPVESGKNGLSPRVRGNPHPAALHRNGSGSIPACAGEPLHVLARVRANWVYPRVCGGTLRMIGSSSKMQGLSPRVRGNQSMRRCDSYREGSIPACAGEPRFGARMISKRRVYPRVCGGTAAAAPLRKSRLGLSPRVRGNPLAVP